jgi:hypothetical protein
MFAAVVRLEEAIDDLFALDPDMLTDTELHQTVIALHRQNHRLAAARARLLARWDTRAVWARRRLPFGRPPAGPGHLDRGGHRPPRTAPGPSPDLDACHRGGRR